MKRLLVSFLLGAAIALTLAASLPDADRHEVYADLMRLQSAELIHTGAITKSQMRAAVDATDQWISDNSTSYNNSLPLIVRNTLSNKEKARLFLVVAKRRFDIE